MSLSFILFNQIRSFLARLWNNFNCLLPRFGNDKGRNNKWTSMLSFCCLVLTSSILMRMRGQGNTKNVSNFHSLIVFIDSNLSNISKTAEAFCFNYFPFWHQWEMSESIFLRKGVLRHSLNETASSMFCVCFIMRCKFYPIQPIWSNKDKSQSISEKWATDATKRKPREKKRSWESITTLMLREKNTRKSMWKIVARWTTTAKPLRKPI